MRKNHKHRWVIYKQEIFGGSAAQLAMMSPDRVASQEFFDWRWCTVPGCYRLQKCTIQHTLKYIPLGEQNMQVDDEIAHDRMFPKWGCYPPKKKARRRKK